MGDRGAPHQFPLEVAVYYTFFADVHNYAIMMTAHNERRTNLKALS